MCLTPPISFSCRLKSCSSPLPCCARLPLIRIMTCTHRFLAASSRTHAQAVCNGGDHDEEGPGTAGEIVHRFLLPPSSGGGHGPPQDVADPAGGLHLHRAGVLTDPPPSLLRLSTATPKDHARWHCTQDLTSKCRAAQMFLRDYISNSIPSLVVAT